MKLTLPMISDRQNMELHGGKASLSENECPPGAHELPVYVTCLGNILCEIERSAKETPRSNNLATFNGAVHAIDLYDRLSGARPSATQRAACTLGGQQVYLTCECFFYGVIHSQLSRLLPQTFKMS